jgi:hypothetical protein
MHHLLILLAALAAAFTAPEAASAQSGAAIRVTPGFLIGRWTDDGNCSNTIEFFTDGTFAVSNGAVGRWSLQGDRLTFQGNSSVTARAEAASQNRIVLRHANGTVGESTRCSVPRVAMPAVPATPQAALAMGRTGSRAELLGRWTDTGDCAAVVTFFPGGGFLVSGGGGTWTLVGDRLTFTGQSVVGARVRFVGSNRILLIHDNQTVGQSMRC